jgi:hypothetical protein
MPQGRGLSRVCWRVCVACCWLCCALGTVLVTGGIDARPQESRGTRFKFFRTQPTTACWYTPMDTCMVHCAVWQHHSHRDDNGSIRGQAVQAPLGRHIGPTIGTTPATTAGKASRGAAPVGAGRGRLRLSPPVGMGRAGRRCLHTPQRGRQGQELRAPGLL